ncbi:MAG: xanthine dehydrogenase family protein molybdopterin-binding subunit [Pseudomonadales bacterium]|nr:xanthine dehydrogenase family protein molybdopterin-binding subunit [Pseudomonadales bacterium]
MSEQQAGVMRYVGTRPPRPDGVDKVSGRALFGADVSLSGMVWGAVLRSPHAHARILGIDTGAALRMPGVLAVVTAEDFLASPEGEAASGESQVSLADLSRNVLAREKVLYHGHAVAAVAATTQRLARAALDAIRVEYQPLGVVLDLDSAMAPDAPLLHEEMLTQGAEPAATRPSNIASRMAMQKGDVAQGFADAEVVLERTYRCSMAHQGYIEPHACLAMVNADAKVDLWCCTQGQFAVRANVAALLGMDEADIRVIPTEIGGGFGGKTTVYLEPVAVALARKCGRPVKMQMSREEVFRATGPASATRIWVKIGARRDGTLTAMDARLEYEAGAFKGSPAIPGAMTIFASYDVAHQRVEAFDVVVNKPKVAAYRAPGAPQAIMASECLINELATELGIDPLELRLHNAADEGTGTLYGASFQAIGLRECLRRAQAHPHYSASLAPNQGRGVAIGFWFNVGLQSSASVHLTGNGKVLVEVGNPDIGGSRAALALMAAETLGVPYENVRPAVMDTASVGYSDLTGGSRTTYATGYAVIEACRDLIGKLVARAAQIWEVEPERINWGDGAAWHPDKAGGKLGIGELARLGERTGGPLSGQGAVNLQGAAPGFAVNIADVEVDPETGRSRVTRFTAIQDAGRAIHPDFVEGQMQGGAAQGIGWALNEAFCFDHNGVLENAGFLDYRMPVASDLPMIDTVIVEVPHPDHPLGVRGVGETPICAPMPAVVTALNAAAGIRLTEVPLTPSRVLEAILAGG